MRIKHRINAGFTAAPKAAAVMVSALVLTVCTVIPIWSSPSFAARDWGGYQWRIDSKRTYVGETGGSWKLGIRAKADGGPGDTIHMGSSKAVSNSISATCGISKKVLNASFSFNVNRSWTTTTSKTYGLTKKKKGTWWGIQYKPVHKRYKIKVRKYSFIDGRWNRTSQTKWIYAKKFDHFAYRLVKCSAPR